MLQSSRTTHSQTLYKTEEEKQNYLKARLAEINQYKQELIERMEASSFEHILKGSWVSFAVATASLVATLSVVPFAVATIPATIGSLNRINADPNPNHPFKYIALVDQKL